MLTIDQLALAVFTEEYRVQRESFSGDLDAAIRRSFKAALRTAEIAPEFGFGDPASTTEDAALHWAEAQITIHFDALALAAVCESPTP